MITTLLKPNIWIWSRQLEKINKFAITAVITAFLIGGEWAYKRLSTIPDLTSDQTMTLAFLSAFVVMFFIGMLDLKNIIYQLFQSPDLEILMINPVPLRSIYLLKVLQCGWSSVLPGLFLAIYLVIVGIQRALPIYFYPVMILGLISLMALTVSLLLLVVFALVRVISPERLGNWGFIILIVMPSFVLFAQEPLVNWLLDQNYVFVENSRYIPLIFGLSVITLFAHLLTFRLFLATFYATTTAYSITQAQSNPNRVSSRWYVKEWLLIRRDPRILIGFAQPLLFFGLLLLPALQNPGIKLGALGFWMMLILICIGNVMNTGVTTQILLNEGRNIRLLHTLPINAAQILRIKLFVIASLQILFWGIGILVLSIAYYLMLWMVAMLFAALLLIVLGSVTISLGIAAWRGDFDSKNLPILPGLGMLFLNSLWSVSIFILMAYSLNQTTLGQILDDLNIQISPAALIAASGMAVMLIVADIILWQRGSSCLNHPQN